MNTLSLKEKSIKNRQADNVQKIRPNKINAEAEHFYIVFLLFLIFINQYVLGLLFHSCNCEKRPKIRTK